MGKIMNVVHYIDVLLEYFGSVWPISNVACCLKFHCNLSCSSTSIVNIYWVCLWSVHIWWKGNWRTQEVCFMVSSLLNFRCARSRAWAAGEIFVARRHRWVAKASFFIYVSYLSNMQYEAHSEAVYYLRSIFGNNLSEDCCLILSRRVI